MSGPERADGPSPSGIFAYGLTAGLAWATTSVLCFLLRRFKGVFDQLGLGDELPLPTEFAFFLSQVYFPYVFLITAVVLAGLGVLLAKLGARRTMKGLSWMFALWMVAFSGVYWSTSSAVLQLQRSLEAQ